MATYKTTASNLKKGAKPCIYETEDSVFSEFRRKTMGERLKGIRATLRRTMRVKSADSTRQSKPQITTSSEPPSSQFPTSTVSQGESGKLLLAASDCQNSSNENLASSPSYSKSQATIQDIFERSIFIIEFINSSDHKSKK